MDNQPSAAQRARQNSLLCGANLSDADKNILVQALSDFKVRLANAAASPTTLASFDSIAQDTVTLLQTTMSSAGFENLQAHVRTQKKFMKRVPYPAQ